ncbi:unnamed protein product [Cuscuta epithymum]|uniref:Uncharacterized protein n=1 Tax=Cuscuta epithymum TaxID=186058 RepID=A0AAV0CN39_9ASTE|nr:unnamed protein product [Cuscuta epithymum]
MPPLSSRLSAAIRTATAAVKSYFCRCIDFRTLTDFMTTPTYLFFHSHLTKVYATLVLACVCTILGVLLDFAGEVGGRFTFLVFSRSMFWVLKTPSGRVAKKIWYMMAATFFMGASIVPCIRPYVNINHGLLMSIIGEQATCYAVYCLGAAATRSAGRRTPLELPVYYKVVVCSLCSYLFLLLLFFVYSALFRHSLFLVMVPVYMVCYRVALFAYGQEMTLRSWRDGENLDCVTCCLRFYTDFPAILAYTFLLFVKGLYDGLRRRNRLRIMRKRLVRMYIENITNKGLS